MAKKRVIRSFNHHPHYDESLRFVLTDAAGHQIWPYRTHSMLDRIQHLGQDNTEFKKVFDQAEWLLQHHFVGDVGDDRCVVSSIYVVKSNGAWYQFRVDFPIGDTK